jgi:hypothetical protein
MPIDETARNRRTPARVLVLLALSSAGATFAGDEPLTYLAVSAYATESRYCVDDAVPPAFCGTLLAGDALSVAIGDVDGDGHRDIVQARLSADAQVCFNNGQGIFTCQEILGAHPDMTLVAVGDFNVDGRLDAVLGTRFEPPILAQICFNLTGTVLICATLDAIDFPQRDLDVGDINGDGAPDLLAMTGSAPARACLNDGQGVFVSCLELPWSGTQEIAGALADLDGDGNLDAAITTAMPGLGPQDRLCLGNGAGLFSCSPIGFANDHAAVAIGDIDGDGGLDIVFARGLTGVNTVYCPGNGSGSFPTCFLLGGPMALANAVALADLDGDGRAEAAFASAGAGQSNVLCRFLGYAPPPGSEPQFLCLPLDSAVTTTARDVSLWTPWIFQDGFESGDTSRWSSVVQ